ASAAGDVFRATARRFDLTQHDLGTFAIAFALDPDLRLRHFVARNVADDARCMLVEHVRADAGVIEPMRDEPCVVALARGVDADHDGGRQSMRVATRRRSTATSGAARAASHGYGGASFM